DGVAWSALLGFCDGDVSNMAGVHAFDRMLAAKRAGDLTPKSVLAVWGASHNLYNEVFDTRENRASCIEGPGSTPHEPLDAPTQRQTAAAAVPVFFERWLSPAGPGTRPYFMDPRVPLPVDWPLSARVERSYLPAPDPLISVPFDDDMNPAFPSPFRGP